MLTIQAVKSLQPEMELLREMSLIQIAEVIKIATEKSSQLNPWTEAWVEWGVTIILASHVMATKVEKEQFNLLAKQCGIGIG